MHNSYEKRGNISLAFEQWNLVTSIVPTDPTILSRLADACDRENEKGQAYHYYLEVYVWSLNACSPAETRFAYQSIIYEQ